MGDLSFLLLYMSVIAAVPLSLTFSLYLYLISNGVSLNDFLTYRYKYSDLKSSVHQSKDDSERIALRKELTRMREKDAEVMGQLAMIDVYSHFINFFGPVKLWWKLLLPLPSLHQSIPQVEASRYQVVSKYL
jgi:hypothetical protein